MNSFFYGWYFKCQSASHTLSVIWSLQESENGRSCSIQLITEEGVWNIPFFPQSLRKGESCVSASIGRNLFCEKGLRLDLRAEGLEARGKLFFGPMTPIRYDIMGPFRFVPFMECRHSVVSMRHAVTGKITVNGKVFRFPAGEACGYIEGDRGRSFPSEYVWTQCLFDGGSLMLSVAEIPFCGLHFTGIIGVVLLHGREYRLATYLGARADKIADGRIVIRQGNLTFTARPLQKQTHPLFAPCRGAMNRIIRESISCRVYYRLCKDGKELLSLESDSASFEYEYSN